jgi:hypothetical protein
MKARSATVSGGSAESAPQLRRRQQNELFVLLAYAFAWHIFSEHYLTCKL